MESNDCYRQPWALSCWNIRCYCLFYLLVSICSKQPVYTICSFFVFSSWFSLSLSSSSSSNLWGVWLLFSQPSPVPKQPFFIWDSLILTAIPKDYAQWFGYYMAQQLLLGGYLDRKIMQICKIHNPGSLAHRWRTCCCEMGKNSPQHPSHLRDREKLVPSSLAHSLFNLNVLGFEPKMLEFRLKRIQIIKTYS